MPLRFRQQREIRDPAPGIGDDGFEQVPEAGRHTVDRGLLEQISAVLQRDAETIGLPRGHHGEVEESSLPFECDRVDGEPVQVQSGTGNAEREWGQPLLVERLDLLVGEHRLEQGRTAGIWAPLEATGQKAEGIVLMLQSVGHSPANAGQELVEWRVPRQVPSHRQQVDEVADQLMEPRAGSPRHRGTDDDVMLAAETSQKHMEGRQQGRVQARPA